jgi:glycosyltransferase involved in cell wall biosynthesis
MTRPTLLAFGPGRWLRDPARLSGSPRYHLAGLARRGWHVVYIQPPWRPRLKRESFAFDLGKGAEGELTVVDPALVPPFAPRFAPAGWAGELFRSVTSRALSRAGRALLKSPDVVWFGAPWHGALAGLQRRGVLKVWHLYDELDLSPTLPPRARRWLVKWSKELAAGVDLILASSSAQAARWGSEGKAVLLGNAVRDDFAELGHSEGLDAAVESELAAIARLRRPIAIYGGVADERLDRSILSHFIQNWKGSLVLAGTLAPGLRQWLSQSGLLERIHTTGTLPYAAYPSVYRYADVLVLMHRRNPFTDAMWPEKLNEYLTIGKPIVSVPLPEVSRIAALLPTGGIRLADGPEDFLNACEQSAVGDYLATNRQSLARELTWSARAGQLDRILRQRLGQA